LATAVWRPQTRTSAAFRLLATYGRNRRRRRVVGTRSLADPTIACTVAAASGSDCRRLPRHHLRPQPDAGASAPWQVTRCLRGGGTSAHRRSIKTAFVITTAVVPSR
jgi:hypothetical protein